jgi:hypothetical protein
VNNTTNPISVPLTSIKNISSNLKQITVNVVDGQSLVYSAGTWSPTYPTVASSLSIENNGVEVLSGVTVMNFIGTILGTEVKAMTGGNFKVNIYIPAPCSTLNSSGRTPTS